MAEHPTSMLEPFCPRRRDYCAPDYAYHTLDRRYHGHPPQFLQDNQLAAHRTALSTTSNEEIQRSRHAPPPHFSNLISTNSTPASATQDENRLLSPQNPRMSSNHPFEPAPTLSPRRPRATSISATVDFLTLDRDLIFPPPPSQALYSLTFAISASGTSNTLRQSIPSVRRPDGTLRSEVQDRDLYTIKRSGLYKDQYTIDGQRRSTFPGTLVLEKRRNMLGIQSWECSVEKTGEVLIRSKGKEWIDSLGRVVGREQQNIVLGRRQRKAMERTNQKRENGDEVPWQAPVLELVGPAKDGALDQGRIRDLLVVCWMGKCWYSERITNMVPLAPGQYVTKAWRRNTKYAAGSLFF